MRLKHFWLGLGLLALPSIAHAITSGQIDTFEDGTPMAWEEGPFSPNPPANVPTGGPAGVGDHYLSNTSSGDFASPGGKMTMNNLGQWTGDYVAAGVASLGMEVANFGSTPLYVRVALQGASGQYCSTLPFILPADGQWRTATFGLNASELTAVALNVPLSTLLTNVTMLRVLSAQSGPSFRGDEIAGVLGVDNLRVNAPSAVEEAALFDVHRLWNAPNPFAGGTRLHYTLSHPGPVVVDIFDVSGRAVRRLEPAGERAAGAHELAWDGRDGSGAVLAAGVYFARLSTPTFVTTARLLLARP